MKKMQRVIPTGCIVNIQNQFAQPEHPAWAFTSYENVMSSLVASLKIIIKILIKIPQQNNFKNNSKNNFKADRPTR